MACMQAIADYFQQQEHTMKKPTGYVIYRGPSLLDGTPIVAIALLGSSNRKTGNMVQTYILRDDMRPTLAVQTGADSAICGNCKHRPFLGGACYVVVAQGPTVVFKTMQAGKYPDASPADVGTMVAGRMVRLGTYGDPAAVPANVWQALTAQAAGRTGYTHQWANEALPMDHRADIAQLTMASVDNVAEAQQARASGLRYFRIRLATEALQEREFVCPASEEAGKRKLCDTCGACNGTTKSTGASPVIIVHGNKARRFTEQRAVA
jgi:hypothetical protein